jgi:hypothetical protein
MIIMSSIKGDVNHPYQSRCMGSEVNNEELGQSSDSECMSHEMFHEHFVSFSLFHCCFSECLEYSCVFTNRDVWHLFLSCTPASHVSEERFLF